MMLTSSPFKTTPAVNCGLMAWPYRACGIEKKLKALDDVEKISRDVGLHSGRIGLSLRGDTQVDEPTLKELVNDAGANN